MAFSDRHPENTCVQNTRETQNVEDGSRRGIYFAERPNHVHAQQQAIDLYEPCSDQPPNQRASVLEIALGNQYDLTQ